MTYMKNLLLLLLFMLPLVVCGQKDVTKFLGIPVDGGKSEMISKLKEKGFKEIPYSDMLQGEFNGLEVYISIMTNKNKVWRICVTNVYGTNDINIKTIYNNLCYQFKENGKYADFDTYLYIIPDYEDISYEMSVNDKRYYAVFFQLPQDTTEHYDKLRAYLKTKYSDDEIFDYNDDVRSDAVKFESDYLRERTVWFTIGEMDGEYRIQLYYENSFNAPNGQDL